jgi:hypothetical protein
MSVYATTRTHSDARVSHSPRDLDPRADIVSIPSRDVTCDTSSIVHPEHVRHVSALCNSGVTAS